MAAPTVPHTETEFFQRYMGNGKLTDEEFVEQLFLWLREGTPTERAQLTFRPMVLGRLRQIEPSQPALFYEALARFRQVGIPPYDVVQGVRALPADRHGGDFPVPQSATMLLEKAFMPPTYFLEDLLPQGLAILAGKSKRGKTYMSLDMALAMSVGRQAFAKFRTEKAHVLFISLEDGEILVQQNLRKIQPNLRRVDTLSFLYEFPRLGAGALEAMQYYLDTYQVIILDILGRILPSQQDTRKSITEYQLFTDFLGPLHDLVRDRPVLILLLDHLRKSPADDGLDEVMGSTAKVGVMDTIMVYKRKDEDTEADLAVWSKFYGYRKVVLSLVDGHLEYVGEGQQHQQSQERMRVLEILDEEHRPLKTTEIVTALGFQLGHYARIRMLLMRMYKDEMIGKTGRGLWTLGARTERTQDDHPF